MTRDARKPAAGAFAADFGPFGDRVWLDAAHQGPIPRVAAQAAEQAIRLKVAPHRIADDSFAELPRRLRLALGRLIGAVPDDVILGNSASYGLDLLANGIRWRSGDEVLLVDGDFPADVHPWRVAEPQGVTVRLLRPAGPVVQPEELAGELRGRTRLFCTSWVSSFNGHAADARALGQVCRDAGVTFVLNLSQALGARRLEIASLPVDAVTCCGYKWLCGPYGTGFCWLDPRLRESLAERHAYWLAMHAGRGFDRIRDYTRRHDLGARAWDVFCPASFFNVMPWLAAIEYLLQAGGERIERHDQELVGLLLDGFDPGSFELVSPAAGPSRSTLVVLRPRRGGSGSAAAIHGALRAAGIDASLREGNLRFSPHLYNTAGELRRVAVSLDELASRR